ncbi:MAG: hypothetical protein NVSMB9_21760 [Isosphaeraceae bacterium]
MVNDEGWQTGVILTTSTWSILTLRKTITLDIDPARENLLRQYAGSLEEMTDLAATAPDGLVLEV